MLNGSDFAGGMPVGAHAVAAGFPALMHYR